MCYLETKARQVLGKKQLKMASHACQNVWAFRLLLVFHPHFCVPARLQVHSSSHTPLPRGPCVWATNTSVHRTACGCIFPAIVCSMFSNSFALFSIWPQRWGIMVLTLYPAHILYRLSLNTVSLLQRGIKVKAHRLVLSWAHRGSWSNWKGSRIFKKKEVWPNFNPCHFHFSYPVDLGDFIYTVSLSLGIGNQAFMEIIKSTYSTLKVGLTDIRC